MSDELAVVSVSLDDWFVSEILVHDAALTRFLMRASRSSEDVRDVRQEVYVRVFKAAAGARPLSPKSFLFHTARNLLADGARRRRVVAIDTVEDVDGLNMLVDEISPERRTSARQELRRLVQAFDTLPARCRDILWLRRVEDLPQREVAARLRISEKTVEKYVTRALRLLSDAFSGEAPEQSSKRKGRGRGLL